MTGIVLGIMVVLDLLLFGTIDLLWGVAALLSLVFLLAPIYCAKFGRGIKIAFSIVMGIISIVPNLIFIFLVVLIFANLPKGRPFEEKVVVRPAPEVEVAAYKRWIDMYKGLKEGCFSPPRGLMDNPFDYTQPKMNELFSRECEAERAKLLNFHAENVFSIPLSHKDGYFASIDIEIPRLYVLDMYRIELADVARRLDKGDIKSAQQKYIRLWQATENQLSPKLSTLILAMFSNAEVGLLTEFYKKYADKLQLEHNKELINILKGTIPKMDSAITASFIGEYAFSKGIFLESTKGYCFKEFFSFTGREDNYKKSYSERIIETRLFRWPFYDRYKTLKRADEFFYETIELNRKPIYERQRQEYCKKEEEFKEEWLRLENPVGNIFFAMIMPRIGVIINRKDVRKAQTTAMLYLLTVTDPNNPDEIPTDNLTGKKFQVAVQRDTLEIQTEHKDYKNEVYYKVKRKF